MGPTSGIQFYYKCDMPPLEAEVFANPDGSGILVVDRITDNEMKLEALSPDDQSIIKDKVKDWLIHYENLRKDYPFSDAPLFCEK